MIYLISDQTRCIEDEEIKLATTEDCLEYFKNIKEIGLDLETTGFDPYTTKILSIQLGDYENQFVFDGDSEIQKLKPLLEDESKTFLGHNLKFDLRFMLHHKIIVRNTYDTFIAEQIIWNGFLDKRKGLDVVAKRHCGVSLDKSIRGNIHRIGLTNSVIKYGADDVKYLHKIKEAQLKRAYEEDIYRAIELNNLFVPVMAYLEYCGVKLDTKLWQEKIDEDTRNLNSFLDELNNYIIDNNMTEFIDPQLDLFDSTRKVSINWQSPQQTIRFFNSLHISTKIFDKESGDFKESVNANWLKKKIGEHPIIETYIKYRETLKRVTTYGTNWFKYINPVTQRIHTRFQQWMNTGRMSSGGKDGNVDTPNLQNLPSDYSTRRCIIAEEGSTLVNADYDSQEVRIFTDKCQDPALIKLFEDGLGDQHSYTAWQLFPEIQEKYPELTPETIKLIKKEFPEQRTLSKQANFAIQYGGTGATIAENCNVPVHIGERVYKKYFETFKGVKRYFDDVYWSAKHRRYITFNNVTRSKYFIPNELSDSKIKTRAFNFPVQATAADMTKYAGILYWRYLIQNDLIFKCKITIICHDEYLIEVPKELDIEHSEILKQCMEEAGERFCKTIQITATPVITNYWTH